MNPYTSNNYGQVNQDNYHRYRNGARNVDTRTAETVTSQELGMCVEVVRASAQGIYCNDSHTECEKATTMIGFAAGGALLFTPVLPPAGTILGGLGGLAIGSIVVLCRDIKRSYQEYKRLQQENRTNNHN